MDSVEERQKKIDKAVKEWKKKLPRKGLRDFLSDDDRWKFYEILPLYHSLKRDPEEITVERILNRMAAADVENIRRLCKDPTLEDVFTYIKQNSINDIWPPAERCEVVFEAGAPITPTESSNWMLNGKKGVKEFILKMGDAFFDIRVENASYCYLSFQDYDGEIRKIDMIGVKHDHKLSEKLIHIPEDLCQNVLEYLGVDYFTFPDITYDNPLFPSVAGGLFLFFTDGDKVRYKQIWIAYEPRFIIQCGLKNSFSITHFPSYNKVLLMGHTFFPNLDVTDDELAEVK